MEEIIKKCKCGIYLTINQHRDFYQTVKEFLEDGRKCDADVETYNKMIETNTIYELQFYPDTPIGSYTVWGTSLEEIVKKALTCFE